MARISLAPGFNQVSVGALSQVLPLAQGILSKQANEPVDDLERQAKMIALQDAIQNAPENNALKQMMARLGPQQMLAQIAAKGIAEKQLANTQRHQQMTEAAAAEANRIRAATQQATAESARITAALAMARARDEGIQGLPPMPGTQPAATRPMDENPASANMPPVPALQPAATAIAQSASAPQVSPKSARESAARYNTKLAEKSAEDYADLVDKAPGIDQQIDALNEGIKQFSSFSRNSLLGTGSVATLGGLTRLASEPAQNLESAFRRISLKNMVAMFSGMSRAIDTQVERAAYEATQPGLSNDDDVNANILAGGMAITAKVKAESEARRAYLETNKTLNGYNSPVIGKAVVFDTQGNPRLIPKGQLGEATRAGLMDDAAYAKFMLDSKSGPGLSQQNQFAPPPGAVRRVR